MKNFANFRANAPSVIAILILCLVTLSSRKSTASTIDSLRVGPVARLETKPIRLTEEGARQVLKDRADLQYLYGVVKAKDVLLSQREQLISEQSTTIQQLNQSGQSNRDQAAKTQAELDACRKKLRAARWENWLVRAAAVAYVTLKVRAIIATGF